MASLLISVHQLHLSSHFSLYQGSPLCLGHCFFITFCLFPPPNPILIFLAVLRHSLYICVSCPFPTRLLDNRICVLYFFVPSSASTVAQPTAGADFILFYFILFFYLFIYFLNIYLFIYFIYGCVGSSFLCEGFL